MSGDWDHHFNMLVLQVGKLRSRGASILDYTSGWQARTGSHG